MGIGEPTGGPRGRGRAQGVGRAPTLVGRVWPPGEVLALSIFYIFGKYLPWSFKTFGAVQNRSPIFAPFPAQNPSCRHSPSSCKPCKIRENRHTYCDITCNNNAINIDIKAWCKMDVSTPPSLDLACPQAEADIKKYVHMFRDRGVDKIKYGHEGIMIILITAT